MKKTWDTIKVVFCKTKTFKNNIPKRIVVDGIETFDQNKIANRFNKFLLKSGRSLDLQSQPLPETSNSL